MQRKPKSQLEEKAPNVLFVILASLFGFPGAGHIMLGRKALGLAFLSVFGLSLFGMLYEVSTMVPQIMEMAPQILAMDPDQMLSMKLPAWHHPALVMVLGMISSATWALSGIHAGYLAYQRARLAPPTLAG